MNKTAKKLFVNGRYTHMTEFNKEPPKPQYVTTDFGSKGLFKETTTLAGGTKS